MLNRFAVLYCEVLKNETTPPMAGFHPLVRDWFKAKYAAPTAPQIDGWPSIASGRDTLIAAPTGSGKTLAAFLVCVDRLIRRGVEHGLGNHIHAVYVSPLRALSNDVRKNLDAPLAELRALAEERGIHFPEIRTAVRSGDTPASERAKMRKTPPHILVTTPESLFILLTAEKSRTALSCVDTIIIDEIHAMADDKRGAHLALTVERLERLVVTAGNTAATRIGLSATQHPIERIGELLCGNHRPPPTIVDSGHHRELDIAIELTDDELGAVASHEQNGRVYDRIAELVTAHETTLVFVNTRRLVERLSHALAERLGDEQVVAHHGSLSRKMRLAAEQKLKGGQVRCAVATASLELGIDVGAVDLVVQLGSPRAIATLLQRIGRSGHSVGKTPKGRLFGMTRDQLVECSALVRAIRSRRLDAVVLRQWPLDILAQHIVAVCACEDIDEDTLFALVTGAAQYRDLPRTEFDAVIHNLAEGMSSVRVRVGAHLYRDQIGHRLRGRKGARLAAITCGGAIPDNATYRVVLHPEHTPVGTLDEDFAIESTAGDIFLLGNTSWRVRRIEAGKVIVEDAQGAAPTIPFWFGEAPGRTVELSEEVGRLRREIGERIARDHRSDVCTWVQEECSIPRSGAEQVVDYIAAAQRALGVLPCDNTIVAERFFDDAGGTQLIIHSPFGARINKAWGLALRKRFCRSFNFELQAAATDDGIILSLGPPHSFALETVFQFLTSNTARKVLAQAVLGAPVFGTRFRWNATRFLAVLRRTGGKKVPPHILRMRTDDLLSVVFPMQQACLENVVGDIDIPDHPLVNETMRDCLEEFMDIEGLGDLLRRIESGEIEVHARDTPEPSPLSHEIIQANPYAFLDDVPLEERRARAVSLPRTVREGIDGGVIEPSVAAEVEAQIAPRVSCPDSLHDHLLGVVMTPPNGAWQPWFDLLCAQQRATVFRTDCNDTWVATERLPMLALACPGGRAMTEVPDIPPRTLPDSRDSALAGIMRGHLEFVGPRTVAELASHVGMTANDVTTAMYILESEGSVLRGAFVGTEGPEGAEQWVNRRILHRIHRRTVNHFRRAVEPVTPAAYMRFLLRWQRLESGSQAMGAPGLESVVEQLQGFESAAGAWESELIPARVPGYKQAWIDELCLSGRVAWARLSARTVAADGRAAPTQAAPLSLIIREDLEWLRAPAAAAYADTLASLSVDARNIYDILTARGALFVTDLARQSGLRPGNIEASLWELVAGGLASADGFSSLRMLTGRGSGGSHSRFDEAERSPRVTARSWTRAVKRTRQRDRSRPASAVHSLPTAAGRWSLLAPPSIEDTDPDASARLLLARYGVVFREVIARESCTPPWRDILYALRRLEARGEIRGGRFVESFVGEQFALPQALTSLRRARRPDRSPQIVRVAATDPANLVGITSPGSRVPAVIGNAVLYRDGTPVAAIVSGEFRQLGQLVGGEQITPDLIYTGQQQDPHTQVGLPL